jgi:hypothetical protein
MWDNRQGDVEEVGVSVGFERFENVIFFRFEEYVSLFLKIDELGTQFHLLQLSVFPTMVERILVTLKKLAVEHGRRGEKGEIPGAHSRQTPPKAMTR